jgi:type I restriction enzyme S subunit
VESFPKGSDTFFRLSPVADGEPEWFALQRGEAKWRLDPHFHRPRFSNLLHRLEKLGASRLGSLIGRSGELWDQKDGRFRTEFPYIEISAVGLGNDEYAVSMVETSKAPSRARQVVRADDILVSLTRPHRGAIAGIRGVDDGAIASTGFCVLRDLKDRRLSKKYLMAVLRSSIGLDQLLMRSSGGNYPAITEDELENVLIPIPATAKLQNDLVTAIDAAQAARLNKLAEAETLLAGLDDYLLATLGLAPPPTDERKVFAVSLADLGAQARLNADYFHPERILSIRALAANTQKLNCSRLEQVVDFIRDQIKTPGPNYLSLANVQSNTGALLATDENVTGACSVFQHGDVLFARLRPYLNKVHATEIDGCCSPEFHVLRSKNNEILRPDYLAAILRSRLTLAQTRHMMTGNTHPRLTNDDVVNLVIPVPKPVVQEAVAAEARRRRDEARRLRTEADSGWQAAKTWFEEQLLGPVQR